MRCPKCGERERAKGQRWCRECRNVSRRKVDTVDTDGHVSSPGVDTLDTQTDTANRRMSNLSLALAEVSRLTAEVVRLKRELAEANARAWPARGMGRPIPAAKPDNDKQVTPHGARCMCQWCQQQRRVAALEGA